ncbi:tRNA pseudouridine(55) synthase TruB [Thermaerobacter sp. FW80]|uniref:tRNA pseudouridine(55) synthase TruB n=1 Tax=Thermaerobacter sp. FW80 TaxID=2546351 RepID=UPI001FAA6EDE|nr:tRNA pseudouridine(55) synthase TruB [Thermaerobacter sp. FW80]
MTAGRGAAGGVRRPRAATPIEGIVPVLKPPGMTSHDVVDACRRLFGIRRVGHAGTLDPAAAGVLVVCLGTATRLAEYLSDAVKAYRAEIWLGVGTDSHDSEGRLTDRRPAPAADPGLDEGRLRAALDRRRGPQLQVPPAVSAVHQQGERAYRRHRQGRSVALPPRPVTIHRLELRAWWPGPFPRLLVDVVCSKGTYVRALARDLGADLGRPATLAALIRTAQGPFALADAVTLEDLGRALAAGEGRRLVVPPARALAFLPAWVLDDADARRVAHGGRPRPRPHPWDEPADRSVLEAVAAGDAGAPAARAGAPGGRVRLLDEGGRLLAVARLEREDAGWRAIPERVLGGGAGSSARRD